MTQVEEDAGDGGGGGGDVGVVSRMCFALRLVSRHRRPMMR